MRPTSEARHLCSFWTSEQRSLSSSWARPLFPMRRTRSASSGVPQRSSIIGVNCPTGASPQKTKMRGRAFGRARAGVAAYCRTAVTALVTAASPGAEQGEASSATGPAALWSSARACRGRCACPRHTERDRPWREVWRDAGPQRTSSAPLFPPRSWEESGGARPLKIRRSPSGRVRRADRRRRLWMTRMRAVLQDNRRGGRGRSRMTLRAGTIGFLKSWEKSSVVPVSTASRIRSNVSSSRSERAESFPAAPAQRAVASSNSGRASEACAGERAIFTAVTLRARIADDNCIDASSSHPETRSYLRAARSGRRAANRSAASMTRPDASISRSERLIVCRVRRKRRIQALRCARPEAPRDTPSLRE
jgi:hypothetical protein